ncbi:MAG: PQQ-binding-like beta-propeller repeat protein [Acidobacteriota bacterium]|nr:MAG: PQQ-binding-like beta-propeller repeat protein [Acidobacteriota bacterium]
MECLRQLRAALPFLIIIFSLSGLVFDATSSAQKPGDSPTAGGSISRNAVSTITGLPTEWDLSEGRNVKWVVPLGSVTYGTPVVAGGMVFIGTNNQGLRNPSEDGDRGVLMAFREADGEFLWQATSTKLDAGMVNDWPEQGICSTPHVENDRLYYVTSRCEVVCLDTQGFQDGENDGPFQEEASREAIDADIVWVLDMMKELKVFPHNMTSSSPAVYGDLLFVGTSNGVDEEGHLPSPEAPTLLAIDKKTGKVAWSDNSPGPNILHGQWSSPAVGEIGGIVQVVMGMGDGWIRAFEAQSGKKLWEFDTNPKESQWPQDRNNVIAAPVIVGDRVYIANGQDPENGDGVGHFYAIDATKRGDITESGRIWHYGDIRRSISSAAVDKDLIYIADFAGFLHCLDAETGQPKWVHDTFAPVWGSPLVADGKVYLGDEDGDVVVLAAGPEEKVLAEINMEGAVYTNLVPANGVLYVASHRQLFALQVK